MLWIEQTWITSKYKEEIYRARITGSMGIYCKERYGWTDDVFDIVSWDSVSRVCRKLMHTKRMQTCKIMYGWLPIEHIR